MNKLFTLLPLVSGIAFSHMAYSDTYPQEHTAPDFTKISSSDPHDPNNFSIDFFQRKGPYATPLRDEHIIFYSNDAASSELFLLDQQGNIVKQGERNEAYSINSIFNADADFGFYKLVVGVNPGESIQDTNSTVSGPDLFYVENTATSLFVNFPSIFDGSESRQQSIELDYKLDARKTVRFSSVIAQRGMANVKLTLKNQYGQVIKSWHNREVLEMTVNNLAAGDYILEITQSPNISVTHPGLKGQNTYQVSASAGEITTPQRVYFRAKITDKPSDGMLADALSDAEYIEGYYYVKKHNAINGTWDKTHTRFSNTNNGNIVYTYPEGLRGLVQEPGYRSYFFYLQKNDHTDYYNPKSKDSWSIATFNTEPIPKRDQLTVGVSEIYLTHDNTQIGRGGFGSDDVYFIPHINLWNESKDFILETVHCNPDNVNDCVQKKQAVKGNLVDFSLNAYETHLAPANYCQLDPEAPGMRIYPTKNDVTDTGGLELALRSFTGRLNCEVPSVGSSEFGNYDPAEIEEIILIGSKSSKFVESPFLYAGSHFEGMGCKVLLNDNQPLADTQNLSQLSIQNHGVTDVEIEAYESGDEVRQRFKVNATNETVHTANIQCHLDVGVDYKIKEIRVRYADNTGV